MTKNGSRNHAIWLERLVADGTYELPASLLESTGDRFDHSPSVTDAKRLVYRKLIEKYQNTDPV